MEEEPLEYVAYKPTPAFDTSAELPPHQFQSYGRMGAPVSTGFTIPVDQIRAPMMTINGPKWVDGDLSPKTREDLHTQLEKTFGKDVADKQLGAIEFFIKQAMEISSEMNGAEQANIPVDEQGRKILRGKIKVGE